MSCAHDCDRPPRFPAPIANRPGLARFDYRIGDFASLRAHMLDRLVKAPELAGWSHLEADEPGIALLEGVAIVGDILAFYQDLYANETRLGTAAWDDSVLDLVRLTGYRPAPGLGGRTVFALEVDETVVVPAGFAFQAQLDGVDRPSIFETDAAIEAHPALGTFHLYRRRTGLQPIRGASSLDIVRFDGSERLAARRAHGISAGDRILILSGPLDPHEILVVRDTELHLDRVTLHLEGEVRENHPAEVSAFRIGRTFRHYGADAPRSFSTFREDPPKTLIHDTLFGRPTAGTTSLGTNYTTLGSREMPLDSEIDDLAAGSRVVCVGRVAARDFAVVRRIERIVARDVLWAGATAPVSMLLLDRDLRTDTIGPVQAAAPGAAVLQGVTIATGTAGPPLAAQAAARSIDAGAIEVALAGAAGGFRIADVAAGNGVATHDIRRLRIHETLGPGMILRAPPRQVTEVADGRVSFFGTRPEAQALAGRRLLLSGLTDAPQQIVVAADQPELAAAPGPSDDARMWPIRFGSAPLAGAAGFSETDPGVTVHGNLVDATQGETQTEVAIGTGDARQAFQTFRLAKTPLTHLADPARSPPHSADLEIRVEGRLWQPVATFFDRPAEAEVYVVRQGEDGDYVQFGDGINGARLPSGRNNVTATYRVGTGARGDLAPGAEPSAKGRLKPLAGVLMPGPATGGAAPEAMDGARVAAPGRMQSLGRLVGLADYEAEGLAVPGVLKAGAVFADGTLTLTVLTEDESAEAVAAVAAAIRHADRCRGPRRHALAVIGGRRRYVHLALALGYDPAYRTADLDAGVRAALGALPSLDGPAPEGGVLSLSRRRFGQDVHVSQVVAAAQNVEGVAWVRPLAFGRLDTASDDPGKIEVPKSPGFVPRLAARSFEVLALSERHLTLAAGTVTGDEECPA